jgi:hypothetical protein
MVGFLLKQQEINQPKHGITQVGDVILPTTERRGQPVEVGKPIFQGVKRDTPNTPNEWFQAGMTGQWMGKPVTEAEKKQYGDLYQQWQKDQTTLANTRLGVGSPDSFSNLGEESRNTWFETYRVSGKMPPFAFRDAASRNSFTRGYAEYLSRNGITPTGAVTDKVEMDALGGSLKLQQRTFGMMGSFINNIALQIKRVKEIQTDLVSRVGVRALDLPYRELATRFVGSGHERVLQSYLMEISREIGKLSTGSQASIAELSVGAQEKWDGIHDPNLSMKDLNLVLDATREQAYLRRSSAVQEIETTKESMRNIGKQSGGGEKTMSREEFIEDFKKEEDGREPTEAELEQFKAKGFWK